MFLEIIFMGIFVTLWIFLNYYAGYASNFSLDNQDNMKNSLIVHGGKDYNLKVHAMNKGELDVWDKMQVISDIAFLETSKKQNFINLNIGKVKGRFELKLSAPCKISGAVYRNTGNSYDVQFVQSLNKYSVHKNTYSKTNRVLELTLDEDAFNNGFSTKNQAYYVYVPKDTPVDTIYFNSYNENKDIIISLFVEPYTIGDQHQNIPNKEKILTNVKNKNQKYYEGVRYILKKSDLKNKLELNNFVLISSNKRFGASATGDGQNKIIVNYSSPLMFYVNEFSDFDE